MKPTAGRAAHRKLADALRAVIRPADVHTAEINIERDSTIADLAAYHAEQAKITEENEQ